MWEMGHDDLIFLEDYSDRPREINPKRKILLEERKKYPINNEGGCEMLVFDDGLAVCLVQKILGKEYKHKDCVDFEGLKNICCNY